LLGLHTHFNFNILHGTLDFREGGSYRRLVCFLLFLGFFLLCFLKLLVEPIKFLHFLNAKSILLLGTELTGFAFLDNSFTENLRRLRCSPYLVNNIRIDVIF